jgi:hypothetical protein
VARRRQQDTGSERIGVFPAAAGEPPTLPSPLDLLDPHASYFAERRASRRRIARCRIEACCFDSGCR